MPAYSIVLTSALLLAACSQADRNESALHDAAEQSDPASAEILENAAANGTNPQAALEVAANASAATENAITDGVALQAKPNLPRSPNRKDGGQPPDKVATPVP